MYLLYPYVVEWRASLQGWEREKQKWRDKEGEGWVILICNKRWNHEALTTLNRLQKQILESLLRQASLRPKLWGCRLERIKGSQPRQGLNTERGPGIPWAGLEFGPEEKRKGQEKEEKEEIQEGFGTLILILIILHSSYLLFGLRDEAVSCCSTPSAGILLQ